MTKKGQAIEQGVSTIAAVMKIMRRLKKDINVEDEDTQAHALITLKAIEAFFVEDAGLPLWRGKVCMCIAEHMERFKHLH